MKGKTGRPAVYPFGSYVVPENTKPYLGSALTIDFAEKTQRQIYWMDGRLDGGDIGFPTPAMDADDVNLDGGAL